MAALCGAGVGLGVVLVIAGWRGRRPSPPDPSPRAVGRWSGPTCASGLAVGAAVVVGAATGWPVGAVLAGLAGWGAPGLLGGAKRHQAVVARIEAVAGWAEMLRDTMAGSAGLEQAIIATAPLAPLPIRAEVATLAVRLEGERLAPALRAFADEVADPTCDLVVAALVLAAEHQAQRLGELLGSLAAAARDQATMRLRVEAGRARTRTSVKVIVGATGALVAGLALFNRGYLAPYDTAVGQLVLVLVGGGVRDGVRLALPHDPAGRGGPVPHRLRAHDARTHLGGPPMIAALVCGAGFGAGLWLIIRGLYPPRPSLAQALAQLRRLPEPAPVLTPESDGGLAARLGRPAADALTRAGAGWLLPASVRRDLAVLGRSPERHLAEQVTLGLVGLLFAPVITALLLLGGAHLPLIVPVWASLLFAVAGFVAPDLGIRADANRRRRDFRHALSSFLDLVVVALAGGGGVETALADAASVGSGWAFALLRRALDHARLARQTPWAALGRLGQELGVAELSELAASVALAGTEGAKVRASLAAKAASLRTHELAEAETADQAATERMCLPVVLLFAGFLLFLGFPAVEKVLTGL